MTGWIIFGAIIAFFILLFSLKATFVISYTEQFSMRLNVLFLSIGIVPKSEKKPRIKDGKKSAIEKKKRQMLKKQQKDDAKAEKKRLKKEAKKREKESGESKKKKKSLEEILDLVSMLSGAVGKLLSSFGKHLRVKAMRVHVIVGGDDAAKTATTYGIICHALSYAFGPLSELRGFSLHQKEISCKADFLSDASIFDVEIRLSLRVWHLFAMVFSALGSIIHHYINQFVQKNKHSGGNTHERNKAEASH